MSTKKKHKNMMELRTQRNKESKDLQATLMNLGFYEDGMDLNEMRSMLSALQESVNETDIDRAIKESEIDWNEHEHLFSSTTIHQNSEPSQMSCSENDNACSEWHYEVVVTQAVVHRSMNWSPNSHSKNVNKNKNENILYNSIRGDSNRNSENINNSEDGNGSVGNDNHSGKINDSGVNLSRELETDTSGSTSNVNSIFLMNTAIDDNNDDDGNALQASTSSVVISDPSSSYSRQHANKHDESSEISY